MLDHLRYAGGALHSQKISNFAVSWGGGGGGGGLKPPKIRTEQDATATEPLRGHGGKIKHYKFRSHE